MKYSVIGEGDEFAVMLQGWATNRSIYNGIVKELSKKYTVIFPALQGFGESSDPVAPMSVSDYAEAVNALLARLGITRAVFFCHSYGGRVFFKLNSLENRFTAPSLLILSDVAGIVPRRSLARRIKMKLFKIGKRLFPSLAKKLRSHAGSADYNAASDVMKKTLILAVNEDLRHLFPSVSAPTLIMWGSLDDAVPLSDAYIIEASIPDSAVVVFEQSAHFPFITEEERFLAVVRSFFNIN
jgi:pimeloyl-ACP methyl ester carboxylesterase